MDARYTYFFKSPDDGRILGYFVPWRGKPVSIAHVLTMLARSHSTMRRFQIGVKTETQNGEFTRWDSRIYTVYADNEKIPFDNPKIVPLNKEFEFVCPVKIPIVKMIQHALDSNLIMR